MMLSISAGERQAVNERENNHESNEERKAKIRERYKGIDREELEIIPAIKQAGFYEDTSEKRVAVYARVSTGDPNQTSSYELQKNYYQDMVSRRAGWHLLRIYADEGISGTTLQHRDAFLQMIRECEEGKIDLIVTKSVSRFARNILDCIGQVRKLAALPQPVGVFFETENIYTLNSNSEMMLSIISTQAQEESHIKSEIMNSSIEMRFSRGIFLTPALLGYDLDKDGNLTVNEKEAHIVRLCFFMYLFGYGRQQIAETLSRLGCKTKRGRREWTANAVLGILQNERHCGDILARKTWTPNYLDHKSKKNRQNRNQYQKRNHHEAIISRDDFIAVQRLIANAKYGYKGLLPSLQVIKEGALRGFVELNPKWSGFTKADYYDAVRETNQEHLNDNAEYKDKEVQAGDFDFRGFEIARAQFFISASDVSVTFSQNDLVFSKACIGKFAKVSFVELLFDPIRHLLAVRPTSKENRHGIVWAKISERGCVQKHISGSAFLPTVYDILGWKPENKYRIRGVRRQKDVEVVILFDLHDTEVYIPVAHKDANGKVVADPFEMFEKDVKPLSIGSRNKVLAYPAEWVDGFGTEFYRHEQAPELASIDRDGLWDVHQRGMPYNKGDEVQPSSPEVLRQGITTILSTMKKEAAPNE